MAFGDFVVGKESIIAAKKLGLVAVELRAWVQIKEVLVTQLPMYK